MVRTSINTAAKRTPAWLIYLGSSIGVLWLFWQGYSGALGPEPINALEREYGELSLKLLVLTLAITPLRRFAGVNLLKFRRALGLSAFAFAVAHLLVFIILDVQSLARLWEEIIKRPYVTIGAISFALMLPLAFTSNATSIRILGAQRWQRLHQLTYPAAILSALHFIWLSKGFQIEPLLFLGIICALIVTRFVKRRR